MYAGDCLSDPEGFMPNPITSGQWPEYATQESSLAPQEVTGAMVGTGVSQYVTWNYCVTFGGGCIALFPFMGVALTSACYGPACCPPPTVTSISPNVWFAGTTYSNVVLTGTNFIAPANATAACPANTVSVSTPSGAQVALGAVTVNSPTQIVIATVTPPANEITETATVAVSGQPLTPIVASQTITAQIFNEPTITLDRIDLMDVKATGTPNVTGTSDSSAFSYLSVSVEGATVATIGYASGSNAQSNPTFFQLTEPDNSCTGGVPCPGGLETITANYMIDGLYSADKSFNVPTFGMSCYSTALESDYGLPPNGCRPITLFRTRYSGTVINPGSLKGMYCLSFVEDVILNLGSGILNNGTAVQKVNGSIGPTPDGKIHTADGPVPVPFQTVARDPAIIPRYAGVLMDLDQVGTGIAADDTGKKGYITGYRLDLYKGQGISACAHNDNIMAVGACTPATSGCPTSAIQ